MDFEGFARRNIVGLTLSYYREDENGNPVKKQSRSHWLVMSSKDFTRLTGRVIVVRLSAKSQKPLSPDAIIVDVNGQDMVVDTSYISTMLLNNEQNKGLIVELELDQATFEKVSNQVSDYISIS